MNLRDGTFHFSLGQGNIFLVEVHSESLVPIVLAFPAPVEAYRDIVPLALPVVMVPKVGRGTCPSTPVVPPLQTREQRMREIIQLLTRMVSVYERQLESRADDKRGWTESSKVWECLHLAPQIFIRSSSTEDPQEFIDHVYRLLRMMHASITKTVELASFLTT